MKSNDTKNQFLDLINPNLFSRISMSHNWNKMLENGVNKDFLVNGTNGTFIDFICDILNKKLEHSENVTSVTFRTQPSPTLKFVGTELKATETTAAFDQNGLPSGYVHELGEDNTMSNYARYFGVLDNHSFFYEDVTPHNGKRVCTYVDLREGISVSKFTQEHEAYRRIITPAIKKIDARFEKLGLNRSESELSE